MNCCAKVGSGGGRQAGRLIEEARDDAEGLRLRLLSLFVYDVPDVLEDAMLGALLTMGAARRSGIATGWVEIKKLSGESNRIARDEYSGRPGSSRSRYNSLKVSLSFLAIADTVD
jgi:hypothetical protein